MDKNLFEKKLLDNKQLVDEEIKAYLSNNDNILNEQMLYALDSGKRIRSSLYIQTKKMLVGEIDKNDLLFCVAIEMVHAYSLVHDDLPAMDNDDYRRGKPSVHKKYGEDIAILLGDGLLNEAGKIIFDLAIKDSLYAKSGSFLFNKSGINGMIEGQILDLRSGSSYGLDYILRVYEKKTADLIIASIASAAINSNMTGEKIKKICEYGYYLGLSYQIEDDILEDDYQDELNILNVLTRDEAIDKLNEMNEKSLLAIKDFENNEFLSYLVGYLSKREY